MAQRRRFSAEYKREAVAMLDAPGISLNQIATELWIGANVLGRWRRELRQEPAQAFVGRGRALLRVELTYVTKEQDFFEKRQRSWQARRDEVSDDLTEESRGPGREL